MTNKIGVSYGTLSLLGITNARVLEKPTTAHFMVGEKCVFSCKFCSQAKDSTSGPDYLSRITWPKRDWREISSPFVQSVDSGAIKRACIQVVETPKSTGQALELLSRLRDAAPALPISVCMSPTSVSRAELFFERGASQVGLPIDVGSEKLYATVKERDYDISWEVVEKASKKWPDRVTTHFIVGLGETEEEMIKSIYECFKLGVTVGLFAFTPVRGTGMEKIPPPARSSYRRVQIGAFVIKSGVSLDKFVFDKGRIAHIEVSDQKVLTEIKAGIPFQTSGCSFCNRPYYNERPGQIPMNYPRSLHLEEAKDCLAESGLIF